MPQGAAGPGRGSRGGGAGVLALQLGGDRDAWSAPGLRGPWQQVASAGDGAAPRGAGCTYLQHCCRGARMDSSSWECFPNLRGRAGLSGGAQGPPCAEAATRAPVGDRAAGLSSSEGGARARWEDGARGSAGPAPRRPLQLGTRPTRPPPGAQGRALGAFGVWTGGPAHAPTSVYQAGPLAGRLVPDAKAQVGAPACSPQPALQAPRGCDRTQLTGSAS